MNPFDRFFSLLLPDPRAYFQERMAQNELDNLEREIDARRTHCPQRHAAEVAAFMRGAR